jgi:tRNA dimethylallyltransferase
MKAMFTGEIDVDPRRRRPKLPAMPMSHSGVLHVLTGCTAVGKTEWALRWAEARGAEIVSCDSLLFYRGMDVGTAKPSAAELARVPHHLVDLCDLGDRMDVTRYVARTRTVLAEIAARGRSALVVGGSGFYLKAFFSPVADEVAVPAPLRAEVAALPLAVALDRLRALNPSGLETLDTANPRRVARALERCLASGRTLAELAEEFARQPAPFADWAVKLARIDRAPEELGRRIEARVAAMLRAGLVDEVRRLLSLGLTENPSAARAIGYRETIDVLAGRLPVCDLASVIVKNTRALVKKQRTWFRTQLPPHRVVDGGKLHDIGELFD